MDGKGEKRAVSAADILKSKDVLNTESIKLNNTKHSLTKATECVSSRVRSVAFGHQKKKKKNIEKNKKKKNRRRRRRNEQERKTSG